MKKTTQVNIGGRVFTADEDAYEKLHHYLKGIERRYAGSAGCEEIMQDIEARIAELLQSELKEGRIVLNMRDVDQVIAVMGAPEQFEGEAAEFTAAGGAGARRQLFRDVDNATLGGVCAGIAHYFGFDPIWIRLAFVVSLVFFGTGVPLYLILWLVMPAARTTAEKLSMMGEPVNVSSIGRSIESELSEFGNRMGTTGGRRLGSALAKLLDFAGALVTGIFRVVGKIIGVLFLIIGVASLLALGAGIIGVADFVHFSTEDWSASMSIYEYGNLVFASEVGFSLAILGFMLLVGVPFAALVYGGLLLLQPRARIPYFSTALFGLWFIGLVLGVFTTFSLLQAFSKQDSVAERLSLNELGLTADTIEIQCAADPFHLSKTWSMHHHNDFMIKRDSGVVTIGNVSFNIAQSASADGFLEVVKTAKGRSFDDARQNARGIEYGFTSDSATLTLDPFFKFSHPSQLRLQELDVKLLLPVGTVVYLKDGTQRILDDVPNTTNTWDADMPGHFWRMDSDGLRCTDCEATAPEPDTTATVHIRL